MAASLKHSGDDRYAFYSWLRDEEPVYYDAELGYWLISRHADVDAGYKDPETFSSNSQWRFSAEPGTAEDTTLAPVRTMLIFQDPPDHTRLRRLANRAFTLRSVRQLAPQIGQIIVELLEPLLDGQVHDFAAEFAAPLPITVIARVLGLPADDVAQLRAWSDDAARLFEPHLDSGDRQRILDDVADFQRYLLAAVEERKSRPRDDLMSVIVGVQAADGTLTDSELLGLIQLLFVAGNETTTSLLGSFAHSMATNRDVWQQLRADPDLRVAAVEEVLRLESPIQMSTRHVTRDIQVQGTTIEKNSAVKLITASANRDPRVFPESDRFRLGRATAHLTFGIGTHFCLGSPLARLEGDLAADALIRKVSLIKTVGDPRWKADLQLRGIEHLPVELQPASSR